MVRNATSPERSAVATVPGIVKTWSAIKSFLSERTCFRRCSCDCTQTQAQHAPHHPLVHGLGDAYEREPLPDRLTEKWHHDWPSSEDRFPCSSYSSRSPCDCRGKLSFLYFLGMYAA